MSDARAVGRRRFLVLASGAAGAALVASVPLRSLVARLLEVEPAARRLGGLFEHQESAKALGRLYLRAVPHEASRRTLVELIARGLPGGDEAIRMSGNDELRVLLVSRNMRDFIEDRTIELDGWILARTEARLCAVAALA